MFYLLSILIFAASLTTHAGDLDTYYELELEINRLHSQFNKNQEEVAKKNNLFYRMLKAEETQAQITKLQKENQEIIKKLGPLKEELQSLENKLVVKSITGELKELTEVKDKNLCIDNELHYFSNDREFEGWNLKYGSKERRISYYANKSTYIKSCLENRPEDSIIEVDYKSQSLCNESSDIFKYVGTKTKYKTYIKEGLVNIDVSLYLTFDGNEKDKEESMALVRKSMPCVKDFYARHGLKLNVDLKEETGIMDRFKCDHTITISKEHKRPTATEWATHKFANVANINDQKRCKLYIHELAHNLGLADAYKDRKCPDRKIILDDKNIMGDGPSGYSPYQAELNGTQLRTILSPLCD
ncbi:hypothetical protein ABMA79_03140 [Halobacteriovorax sp. HFRX-2_2]|uniref:hypothetical protein n=1 Tax=unclassified Halobacteriovorax TaxID=2639665 RepID=UPI003713417A